MMADDTPDFIPHEGISSDMRQTMQRMAATPFPGSQPDFIALPPNAPPEQKANAVLRFLQGAGGTAYNAVRLDRGPQTEMLPEQSLNQAKTAAQRGSWQTLKDALNDSSLGNFLSNTNNSIKQFVDNATGSPEGAGSALMTLLMLRQGLKGKPLELGSPGNLSEAVQPLSGYSKVQPAQTAPYTKTADYQPQSFFRQYPAPEQPPAASPSEIRAASSPNPPRSNLAKNQRQMAAYKASQQAEDFINEVTRRASGQPADVPVDAATRTQVMERLQQALTRQPGAPKGDPAIRAKIAAAEQRADDLAAMNKASNLNTQADAGNFMETAAKNLFNKSVKNLSYDELKQVMPEATRLQNLARRK